MKILPTFQATIYVGFREGYTDHLSDFQDAVDELKEYTDSVGFCVTATSTRFIYKNGEEDGVAVGIINYPRFPSDSRVLREKAIHVAKRLAKKLKQERVTVVTSEETIMLSAGEDY